MANMDDLTLKSIVKTEIEQALGYADSEFASQRMEAHSYYMGEELGNEVDGKSRVIATEVSDIIEWAMPSIMRVFTATPDFVKFAARMPEDVAYADQCTAYVNFIMQSDNDGFRVIHNWIKDSLLNKIGVLKVYWDEEKKAKEETYEGLSEDELVLLIKDDDVEIKSQKNNEVIENDEVVKTLYDVEIKKTEVTGKVKVDNIPPEEFLVGKRTKSFDDADFMCHRTTVRCGDLIAMGYDRDLVERAAGAKEVVDEQETNERFDDMEGGDTQTHLDPSMKECLVNEVYIRIDSDGDGIPELRRIVALGNGYEIVENDLFDLFPFAVISPILMPHRLVGRSLAELVTDLQRIKTTVLRQMLDALYITNNPRVVAVEGQVSIDDLLNAKAGGIVRARAPNMVQPLTTGGVAPEAFPLIQYLDEVRESRTGLSKASMGLDADALQSTTATAVQATLNAAQGKIEMMCRVMAETGFKDLFLLIKQLVVKHQDYERIVRLRNDYVPMNPNEWDKLEFDMEVNVGLGTGQIEQKMAMLGTILNQQEAIILKLGMNNPLVTLGQYRNTLSKLAELSGFKDTSQFFLDPDNLPPEMQQQLAEQQNQQMTPEQQAAMAEVEIEKAKMQADIQLKKEKQEAELGLKREEMLMQLELRKQELQMEHQLRNVEAQVGADISTNLPRGQ